MSLVLFVETRKFTTRVLALVPDEEYRRLQLVLAERPSAGVVIPGTGGVRKVRWAGSGRGKRGGMRYFYYWLPQGQLILMLFVFAKNEQSDLSPAQRAALKRLVQEEFP